MVKVGLTGGIATGKSTVAKIVKSMGIPVIDTDRIAREVVEPGTEGHRKLVEAFGEGILNPDGTVNRALLGRMVFSDREKLKKLESILHPLITSKLRQELSWLEGEGHPVVVIEVPLLFEKGLDRNMDYTVVVYAPLEEQLKRLIKRDGLSRDEAISRIKSQMPIEEKRSLADFVIDNTGDLKELERKTKEVFERILDEASRKHKKHRGSEETHR